MEHRGQQTAKKDLPLAEPELTLAWCGKDLDPRMVELVRLLARRAAREWYDKQIKEGGATRS